MADKLKNSSNNFYWGASTSAHQVEGGAHNNWSEWEKKNAVRLARSAPQKWSQEQLEKFPEMTDPSNYISGDAADHYNRYTEDFDLVREGGHNAHRFSIDWARIEPEKGKFDLGAIAHYIDVVKELRARGIEPFVTLWHWTHPLWLEKRGGVLARGFAKRFAHYACAMVTAFDDAGVPIKFVMTLNEPMSVISSQYMTGAWPHKRKGVRAALKAYKHLADAHVSAYQAIKKEHHDVQVGFTEILTSYEPRHENSFLDTQVVRLARYWTNERFIKLTEGLYDFLGVQYYFHYRIGIGGVERISGAQRSDLGWELYTQGLGNVIEEYARYGVPLYVTEDGLADRSDNQRVSFLEEHIGQVMLAREKGIDIRGYFHWSLMDNFEWDKGFWPRFGLVAVDFRTHKRTPRPSFHVYKKIIEQFSSSDNSSL